MGLLRFVLILGLISAAPASAQDPLDVQGGSHCTKALHSAGVQTSFMLLPRGGVFNRMSPKLKSKEMVRLAADFDVRWVSVDVDQHLLVSEVAQKDATRWLERLRNHPRVVGVQAPVEFSKKLAARDRFIKNMPLGVTLNVLVTFPNEEAATPSLEILMRRKFKDSLTQEWGKVGRVRPVKAIWVYADRVEVLLEDANDRMLGHIRLIPGASRGVRAELVSAY